eukprot:XP_025002711.1 WD repeat-containing protein 73 isoform X2 [Gallus gallus]
MEAAGERGEEEEEEEWLLQSLHLYEALHAFELQAPTRVIEWALGKRVCVAGYGCAGRNEILQLLPPPALQAKESRGLCPERDFKVECGGFSNRPVYNLKHVPDTRYGQRGHACWGGGLVLFALACFPTQLVGAESSASPDRERCPSQRHAAVFGVQRCVGGALCWGAAAALGAVVAHRVVGLEAAGSHL